MNIFSSFFAIKRLQRKQYELESKYLDADLELAKIENQLITLETPTVRPYLAREFALQRAFSRLGFTTKSTEECIKMARLRANRPQ